MAYEMRAGQGSLFKNDKKTSDKHPNLKGKVMLPNGEVRWVSGWSKRTAAGEAWISFAIGELVAGQPVSQHSQAKGNGFQPQGDDSDIPF
jgi:hypothetical protein